MYEYYVLSNFSFGEIILFTICGIIPFCAIVNYLGSRDACTENSSKSFFRKIIPWGVLCVFLSEVVLLIYRLIYYPWETDPSITKGMRYEPEHILLWGWANDNQMPILYSLSGVILWAFWTIYAFRYKPSATSLWKKACKMIAYIIISISILGFNIHYATDFFWWAIILVVVIVLLKISSAKKVHQEDNQEIIHIDMQVCTKKKEKKDIESLEYNKSPISMDYNEQHNNEADVYEITKDVINTSCEGKEAKKVNVEKNIMILSSTDVSKMANEINNVQEKEISNDNLIFCKYCGKRIEADSLFCKYCGRKL